MSIAFYVINKHSETQNEYGYGFADERILDHILEHQNSLEGKLNLLFELDPYGETVLSQADLKILLNDSQSITHSNLLNSLSKDFTDTKVIQEFTKLPTYIQNAINKEFLILDSGD